MDLYTISKIRSLSKQRRRARREKMDVKFSDKTYEEQMKELAEKNNKKEQKKQIADKIQTIKAMEIIGADTTELRSQLREMIENTYR